MAKTMTALQQKTMTDGQIDNLVNRLRDAVRKHRNELGSEAVQEVLGIDNLGMVLFDPFRKLVEIASNMFTYSVKGINRDQSPQEAIDATDRRRFANQSFAASIPRGEGKNVELKIFELDYGPTAAELDAEYERRGLKADPFALCKHMENYPEFADVHPVVCQWDLDGNGEACFVSFSSWRERNVCVGRRAINWGRNCRFAGVHK